MATAQPITLSPLNDFAAKVKLKQVDSATGAVSPLTTGTVTAFFATSILPTATAAHASLSTSATHIGDGVWLVLFDAAILTPALLDGLFTSTPPVLIAQQVGGMRVWAPVTYLAARPATVG